MRNRYFLLSLFVLVATAQLYVPSSMIMEREDILDQGKAYRFKTQPIDPNDPMRGKYITLSFKDDQILIPGDSSFVSGMEIFAQIKEDNEGYAIIENIKIQKPDIQAGFVKAEIWNSNFYEDTAHISIRYPFNRYYMEENKAPIAEEKYIEAIRDSTSTTYAIVKIKDGEAVLEDVMIDGVSINEIVSDQKPE